MPSLTVGPLNVEYDHRVLAPRPWTLAQVDWGAALWREGPVLELCSGVGHIGLGLAAQVPAHVVMVDSSPVASAFARSNARRARLADRVEVRCAPLAEAVRPEEQFDLVLADPPWVPTALVSRFPDDPVHTIDGGHDGLVQLRTCLDLISRHLTPDGNAIVQVGPGQIQAIRDHADEQPGLGLTALTARSFGTHGALVQLSRRR